MQSKQNNYSSHRYKNNKYTVQWIHQSIFVSIDAPLTHAGLSSSATLRTTRTNTPDTFFFVKINVSPSFWWFFSFLWFFKFILWDSVLLYFEKLGKENCRMCFEDYISQNAWEWLGTSAKPCFPCEPDPDMPETMDETLFVSFCWIWNVPRMCQTERTMSFMKRWSQHDGQLRRGNREGSKRQEVLQSWFVCSRDSRKQSKSQRTSELPQWII